MKKLLAIILPFTLFWTFVLARSLSAAEPNVVFMGQAQSFVVSPDNKDLFQNFKCLMPGDVRSQTIVIGNYEKTGPPVSIYLEAETIAKKDEDFLSKLSLEVKHSILGIISAGRASESAGLADRVLLGKLNPGQTQTLTVNLKVPADVGNEYQRASGTIVWVFTAEQDDLLPIPSTGSVPAQVAAGCLFLLTGIAFGMILYYWKRNTA